MLTRPWLPICVLATSCSSSSATGSGGGDAGVDSSAAFDGTMFGDSGGDAGSDATESDAGTDSGAGDAGTGDAGGDAPEAGPPPVVLVPDAPNAWLIATDGSSVYWIDWITSDAGQQNGRVMAVGVDGGAETVLASTPGVIPVGLAIDTANVYWTQSDSTLWQVSKSGGTPTVLQAAGVEAPLTAATGFVYFRPRDGGVQAVPVDGGTVTTLATTGSPVDLVVAAGGVYWADTTGHIAYVLLADAGSPANLVSGTPGQYVSGTIYQNLATDGTNLYWPRGPGGSIAGAVMAVAVSGGGPVALIEAGTDSPRSVATDGVRVYYLDVSGSSALVALPVDGGSPVTITTASMGSADVSGTPGPTIAVDSTSVYWLNPPQIVKVAEIVRTSRRS